jgi:hypothetical protein
MTLIRIYAYVSVYRQENYEIAHYWPEVSGPKYLYYFRVFSFSLCRDLSSDRCMSTIQYTHTEQVLYAKHPKRRKDMAACIFYIIYHRGRT